ncbi:MAG: hypothetical protein ACK4OP_08420 [Gemmobacter sp.]
MTVDLPETADALDPPICVCAHLDGKRRRGGGMRLASNLPVSKRPRLAVRIRRSN